MGVRAAFLGRAYKSEARNPNLETISNDPNEICFAFHGAGQNPNDRNRIMQHSFSRFHCRGFVFII